MALLLAHAGFVSLCTGPGTVRWRMGSCSVRPTIPHICTVSQGWGREPREQLPVHREPAGNAAPVSRLHVPGSAEPPIPSGVPTAFPRCLKDTLDVSWAGKRWDDHTGPQPMSLSHLAQLGTDFPRLRGQFEEFVLLLSPILCDPLQGQSIENQRGDKSS